MKFNSDKNNLPRPLHSNPMQQHRLETNRLKGSSPEKGPGGPREEIDSAVCPLVMNANSMLLS